MQGSFIRSSPATFNTSRLNYTMPSTNFKVALLIAMGLLGLVMHPLFAEGFVMAMKIVQTISFAVGIFF